MSLFGSREEDPLLQNDPFAPSADNDSSEEGGPASSQPASDAPDVETRTIECTQDEAQEGDLGDLNQALLQNWRLIRVHLQTDGHLVFKLQRDADHFHNSKRVI